MLIAIEYVLCIGTAFLSSLLLLRAWRRSGTPLLFWSGLCFGLLGLSNLLVLIDRLWLPDFDSPGLRIGTAVLGVGLLLYGLVFERDRG